MGTAMLYRTLNVCFPRSGHHALSDVLLDYFGTDLKYCERYLNPDRRLSVCPETNFEKTHDFDLLDEFPDGCRLLVQVRNPFKALDSWNALSIRTTGSCWGEKELQMKLEFWTAWVSKWVVSKKVPRLLVPYERLVESPMLVCRSVIQFMTGIQNVDAIRLHDSLAKFPIVEQPHNALSLFSFV